MATSLGLIMTTLDRDGVRPRHALADATGLTRATVTNAARTLIDHGLVVETDRGEASRRGGPRPIMLSINAQALNFVGLDLRREKFTACLVDLGGRMVAVSTRPVPLGVSTADALAAIDALLDELFARAEAPVAGIGIGSVGPLTARDTMIRSRAFTALNDVPIVARLAEAYGVPVVLKTGAVVAAHGEERVAAEQNRFATSVAFVVIDYAGIGLGLISGGEGWITDHGGIGELGHVVIERGGRQCSCGRQGCLLEYASGAALLELLGIEPDAHPGRLIAGVVQAAEQGDPAAQNALIAVGEHLGTALTDMDRILRPERIVIGASHEGLADWYLRGVMKYVRTLYDTEGERPLWDRLVPAQMGSAAIAYGAGALQLKHALREPDAILDHLSRHARRTDGPRPGRPTTQPAP